MKKPIQKKSAMVLITYQTEYLRSLLSNNFTLSYNIPKRYYWFPSSHHCAWIPFNKYLLGIFITCQALCWTLGYMLETRGTYRQVEETANTDCQPFQISEFKKYLISAEKERNHVLGERDHAHHFSMNFSGTIRIICIIIALWYQIDHSVFT